MLRDDTELFVAKVNADGMLEKPTKVACPFRTVPSDSSPLLSPTHDRGIAGWCTMHPAPTPMFFRRT